MKRLVIPALALLAFGLVAQPAFAGRSGEDRAVQLRIGGFFPTGDGEFWNDTEQIFTLDASDFDGVIVGASYVNSLGNYLEVGLNADIYQRTVLSAERDFTDEFGDAVLHDTELSLVPVSVDLRILPTGRYANRRHGRGTLRPVIYLGGGIGATFFEYEEFGDFVGDFGAGPEVFFDRFRDSGVAFAWHAVGGVEFPITRNASLLLEARHTWADAELDADFGNLEIELGGPAAYVGGSFRF